MDGPAHLYNSQLINQILFGDQSILQEVFKMNPELIPNWTGHFMLSFFNLFLPAFLSEKAVLLFYVIGLPYSFRALIKTISPTNTFFSYLIFPFTYCFFVYMGFYNFLIALVFLLITFNFWLKHQDNHSFKTIVKLLGLITLTYFSHVFVFVILLFLIGLHILLKTVQQIFQNSNSWKNSILSSLTKTKTILLGSSLPLVLFIIYWLNKAEGGNNQFVKSEELLEWLGNMRPFITFHYLNEKAITQKIAYFVAVIFILALFGRIRELTNKSKSAETKSSRFFKGTDFWLVTTLIFLVMYFKLPDFDSQAGFISVRLGLLFILFLFIWLAAQDYPGWFHVFVPVVVLYFHCNLRMSQLEEIKTLAGFAKECNTASEKIQDNSVVVPVYCTDSWLVGHFSNYLGVDKPMVILENYECIMGYFPVKWNEEHYPNFQIGSERPEDFPCLKIKTSSPNRLHKVDYVFVIGNIESKTDSCSQKIKQNLSENYSLHHSSQNCKLYKLRN